ncbi:MAG: hypothetical protein GTO02_03225 [Candidatus Dadabacteria bacterium]|nr:hypothetical protein [Candidatus Dadabacteria bacterium]NIQ13440.1 hypothetical protein [Candidatus Dadabacteria bacterium]
MNYFKYLIFSFLLIIPTLGYSGIVTQSSLDFMQTDEPSEEVFAVYDLRNRKSYIQITSVDDPDKEDPAIDLCIHVQIFQQDRNCDELNFEDKLTPNDTVIYDLENFARNDGSPVPINLDDNSYGFAAISSFNCNNRNDGDEPNLLLGNFRIIDESGYEYRMNLITDEVSNDFLELTRNTPPPPSKGNINIPFNTIDDANQADIIAFVVSDREVNFSPRQDLVYNEENGITFDVFQIDDNEERLSCDRKTFGCGPNVVFNYGINEDYPASRGDKLLCEGAGLIDGQTNGYISLENASFVSSVTAGDTRSFHLVCVYGLNNGNGTGSMDECFAECLFGTDGGDCLDAPPPPP